MTSQKNPMTSAPLQRVVVPGTFDPVTFGHLDVISRARRIAPQVTVAVAASADKGGTSRAFSLEERVEMIQESIAELNIDNIDVKPMRGLLVDFCAKEGADAVVKGLRAATDFEYELAQADLNVRMSPHLESIFIMSNPEYGYVSSSVVREIASLGGDVSFLVPEGVAARLKEHFGTDSMV